MIAHSLAHYAFNYFKFCCVMKDISLPFLSIVLLDIAGLP